MSSESAKPVVSTYKSEFEETLQDMKIINHCCVHMTRLIDDVLTLSKLGTWLSVLSEEIGFHFIL